MPALNPGSQNPIPQLETAGPTINNSVVWIVVVVVGGIIFIGAAVACALIYYTKRRRERHPYLIEHGIIKERKGSEGRLSRKDEERRQHMIRKSLASRSTDSAGSSRLSAMMEQIDRELLEIERQERQESTRLKDDWKQWEARVRHERSKSGDQHPATASASVPSAPSAPTEVPILAIPSPAKHRSHGRVSSLRPPTTPPVPARHPGRCSPS